MVVLHHMVPPPSCGLAGGGGCLSVPIVGQAPFGGEAPTEQPPPFPRARSSFNMH